MKCLWLLFLIPSFIFSQNASTDKTDSIEYYIQLANFNKKTNNYKFSLLFSQKAFNYAKKNNDTQGKAIALFTTGVTYFELQKTKDAIETFNQGLVFFNSLPPSTQKALCYYNIGLCYMEMEDFTQAESNFEKANTVYAYLNIDARELLNLQKGILYKIKGKKDLAFSLFSNIISKPDYNDVFKTKAEALYQIGLIEKDNNRNNAAIIYFEKALQLNESDYNLSQKAKILIALSLVNEKNDLQKSHSYLKKYLAVKDSLSILNNEKLDADDYAEFKESEKMKRIELLNKENESQQKTNKFAKLISILAIALISILSLLSLSLYKNNIIRNQSNILLKEKNIELQKEKEKVEQASRARTEFLSTVSHELRTPLNAINGITHLLMEEKPKKSQLNYLNSLKFSGDYLLTYINEILEINRIESDNIEIEYLDFNLKEHLRNIHNSLIELAHKNHNEFILDIDENIPDNIMGDPTKLSQIFINLINNALKFTKNGVVTVSAKLISLNKKNAVIHFEIKDTGIGIPEEKQKTIFDSFSQGSIEINRKYGGTGLGLTIVKKLIDLLGGKIKLFSKVGMGSSFKFDLDFLISKEKSILEEDTTRPCNYKLLKNKKVLVVEDNKINQMITKKMLENKGMICKIIDNGEDSISSIKNEDFDLVLMDVHLPGISGNMATQHIREFNTKVPIIALTAITLNENRQMLLSFGMTDVITKPFEPENFYSVIVNTLSKA